MPSVRTASDGWLALASPPPETAWSAPRPPLRRMTTMRRRVWTSSPTRAYAVHATYALPSGPIATVWSAPAGSSAAGP